MLLCLGLSASICSSTGCTSPPSATLNSNMNPVYLERHMRKDISLEFMFLNGDCLYDFDAAGSRFNISCDVPSPLEQKAEMQLLNAQNTSLMLNIRGLGEEDSGDFNVVCTIVHTAPSGTVSNFSSELQPRLLRVVGTL